MALILLQFSWVVPFLKYPYLQELTEDYATLNILHRSFSHETALNLSFNWYFSRRLNLIIEDAGSTETVWPMNVTVSRCEANSNLSPKSR